MKVLYFVCLLALGCGKVVSEEPNTPTYSVETIEEEETTLSVPSDEYIDQSENDIIFVCKDKDYNGGFDYTEKLTLSINDCISDTDCALSVITNYCDPLYKGHRWVDDYVDVPMFFIQFDSQCNTTMFDFKSNSEYPLFIGAASKDMPTYSFADGMSIKPYFDDNVIGPCVMVVSSVSAYNVSITNY